MAAFEELLVLKWPSEFIVEYTDGRKEQLYRGEGVLIIPPADDPEGFGMFCADLPKKHPRNQKKGSRCIRFPELRAILSVEGERLWPVA